VRPQLRQLKNITAAEFEYKNDGDVVSVAGLITVRQRPGTAKGILFMTLEDETGSANLVVWEKLFDQYRKEIIQSRLLMVTGKLQKANNVIHLVVYQCFNLTGLLNELSNPDQSDTNLFTPARGDETTAPVTDSRQIFHKGRNFR
jgi:error-prone DNA polymerase